MRLHDPDSDVNSGLDFTPSTQDTRTYAEDAPVIVVMHGLTGGKAGDHCLHEVLKSWHRVSRVLCTQYPGTGLYTYRTGRTGI
jgi:predicted alpha/beta-fold hydrolase